MDSMKERESLLRIRRRIIQLWAAFVVVFAAFALAKVSDIPDGATFVGLGLAVFFLGGMYMRAYVSTCPRCHANFFGYPPKFKLSAECTKCGLSLRECTND